MQYRLVENGHPLALYCSASSVSHSWMIADPTRNDPLPSPWPFDQPPDCAVFTTTHVLRNGEPITHIYHDEEDHGWQFHYPGEKSAGDCMIVALETIVRHDRTVLEVAELPAGYVAIRDEIGAPWHFEQQT